MSFNDSVDANVLYKQRQMILLNDVGWSKTENRPQQVAAKLCNYQHLAGSESWGFVCQPIRSAFQKRGNSREGCGISGVHVCVRVVRKGFT